MQEHAKIRIPAPNIKANDVLYQIPEPVILSNMDDDTTSNCWCAGNIKMLVSLEETSECVKRILRSDIFNTFSNKTESIEEKIQLVSSEFVSFKTKKREIYLTARGENAITKIFRPSKFSSDITTSELNTTSIINKSKYITH